MAGTVALVIADEQDGAEAELDGGAGGVFIETAGGVDGSGAEGEDERRWAGLQEFGEVRREAAIAVFGVIKTEAGDEGIGRPVALLLAKEAGEEGENEIWGVLGVKERIRSAGQSELAPEIVDRLRPAAADEAGEAADGAAHARNGTVGAGQAGIHRQHGWIEG